MPNIAIAAGGNVAYPLGVLWSLGVEEQVYLVWPFIVRRLEPMALAGLFLAVCLAEPALRYALFPRDPAQQWQWMLTWLRLDGFAIGALLALAARSSWCTASRLGRLAAAGAVVATCAAVAMRRAGVMSRLTRVGASLQFAVVDVLCGCAIAWALARWSRRPLTGAFSAVLRYCGRVSYCLYLIHQFMFWLYDRFAVGAYASVTSLPPALVRSLLVVGASTAIAELSWRFVEAPILARKPRVRAPRAEVVAV